jgi:hypothetical protein
MKTALITFGCSWMFGVGCNYLIDNPPKTEAEFKLGAWDENLSNQYSFRGILSKKYNLTNINFSIGGSSNQKQFRFAKEFFMSSKYDELANEYDKIIVLWGMTSTARNELYSLKDKDYRSFFYHHGYNPDWPFTTPMLEHCYDHDVIVNELSLEMKLWDELFKNRGIKNVWFDTFNQHNYNYTKNLLFADQSNRDIVSILARTEGLDKIENRYHYSNWPEESMSDRIEFLVNKKLLNHYSKHPTREGHEKISLILSPEIEKLI